MSVGDGATYNGRHRKCDTAETAMHESIEYQRPAYKSRLTNWNSRASVRVGPARQYTAIPNTRFFTPELIAVLGHPIVRASDALVRRTIETQRLYTFLDFTEKLERRAVIPACSDLAEGAVAFLVPDALRHDASNIVTDEGHHATCAASLTAQITAVTGERPCVHAEPAFMAKLRAASGRFTGMERRMAKLTFTAVSETLITGTLTRVPEDESVHPVIREVILDHARDEAYHRTCFADVIRIMWETADTEMRDVIGPLFAEFIVAFQAPDLVAEAGWLEAASFDPATAKKIIDETYEATDLVTLHRQQAKPTISMMRGFGMLDHPSTHDALAQRGLVVE